MSGDAGNCYVDLSNIESKLSSIDGTVYEIKHELSSVNSELNVLDGRQSKLEQDLAQLVKRSSIL
ncbi:MAG: hypothetical protein ACPL1K_04030 [Candidatus Kryptoniota bacterium]